MAIERVWFLHRARMNTREFMERINAALAANQLDEATRLCEEYRGPLSSIFHAALRKHRRSREEIEKAIESSAGVEVAKMERNLVILATMGKMAPLLGFYGTVTGMITAFESIAKAGMGDPGVVAGGIAEALITTAAGPDDRDPHRLRRSTSSCTGSTASSSTWRRARSSSSTRWSSSRSRSRSAPRSAT